MSSPANEYGQGEATLSKAAGMVTDARADFTTLSQQLSSQIDGMKAKWGGQGAAAFFVLHQTWSDKQRVVVNALDDFANSLTHTEKDNVSTDEAQGSSFSHLTNRLS
ncbi:hypothetical protein BH11ACT8_BH11ACT8_34800 [soil metagenome]